MDIKNGHQATLEEERDRDRECMKAGGPTEIREECCMLTATIRRMIFLVSFRERRSRRNNPTQIGALGALNCQSERLGGRHFLEFTRNTHFVEVTE